jgi:hypothetical protein
MYACEWWRGANHAPAVNPSPGALLGRFLLETTMAQGEFTKQEAAAVKEAAEEIFKALPKTKQRDYIGHLNDLFLFIEADKRAAPEGK